jgi:hypothetical protein
LPISLDLYEWAKEYFEPAILSQWFNAMTRIHDDAPDFPWKDKRYSETVSMYEADARASLTDFLARHAHIACDGRLLSASVPPGDADASLTQLAQQETAEASAEAPPPDNLSSDSEEDADG